MMATALKPDGKESVPCYIGRCKCGALVAAMVDDPETRERRARDHAKTVAEWIRHGLTIERSTVGVVRTSLMAPDCTCPDKTPRGKKAKQQEMPL